MIVFYGFANEEYIYIHMVCGQKQTRSLN
jgi:hypothetical protein